MARTTPEPPAIHVTVCCLRGWSAWAPLRSAAVRRLVPLALAALAAAACNGGGDDRLSKEEYVRRADAICARYDARLAKLPQPTNLAGLERTAGQALPIAREGVERLRALRPPEELDPKVRDWLARNDENVAKIGELQAAAQAGDTRRVQELAAEAADNEARADAIAKEIGLRDCAKRDEGR